MLSALKRNLRGHFVGTMLLEYW
uniref:Uncharacterized protein n=1 Tax=Anguilla anguilla TaxID=7936 RepID=A0A0E9ULR9_ANGAN